MAKLGQLGPFSETYNLASVPVDAFSLSGKLHDTNQITNASSEEVTLRGIWCNAAGDVTVITITGNTVKFTVALPGPVIGFFNAVKATGTTIADSDMVALV